MATGPGGGFSITSLLDQLGGGGPGAVSSGPAFSSKSSLTNGRSSDARRNGDGSPTRKERPAPIGVPSRNIRDSDSKSNTVSPLNTFTPPISKALDATTDALEKKRKLEENGAAPPSKKSRFEGMTKEQKIAEVKRLKALKAARDAARANGSAPGKDGNGSGSAASNPNSPITAEAPKKPPKGSYAEIMERAKQAQASSIVPAKIVHKETKVEKKKLLKPDKPEVGKKLSAGSSKPLNGKPATSSSLSKPSPAKKPIGKSTSSSSRPDDRRSAPVRPDSKPKVETVEWKGTARPSATSSKLSSKPTSRPSDRDRERSRDRSRDRSWERERERVRYRSPPQGRYRWADDEEDDYYSSDDMEATGVDILEEEDFSREVGVREDIEAEKLERKLAAEKARKRIGRR